MSSATTCPRRRSCVLVWRWKLNVKSSTLKPRAADASKSGHASANQRRLRRAQRLTSNVPTLNFQRRPYLNGCIATSSPRPCTPCARAWPRRPPHRKYPRSWTHLKAGTRPSVENASSIQPCLLPLSNVSTLASFLHRAGARHRRPCASVRDGLRIVRL